MTTTNSHAKQPNTPAPRARTVRFKVKRQDAPGKPARWEEFDVPVEPNANIVSCLQWIAEHPKTRDGKTTTPLSYEVACLEEVCGSCTMIINGKVRQACSALVDFYAPNEGDTITLEPMSKFPVVRDLAVDRARFFNDLKRIRGWVPIDGTYHLGSGPSESPAKQGTRYVLSTCMTCGCCLDACPQYTLEDDKKEWETSFVGAAVISQARYFNMHETGKTLAKVRLDVLSGPGGINDCGNSQNCVKVCPKEIPLTESIGEIGREVTLHRIKQYFTGR